MRLERAPSRLRSPRGGGRINGGEVARGSRRHRKFILAVLVGDHNSNEFALFVGGDVAVHADQGTAAPLHCHRRSWHALDVISTTRSALFIYINLSTLGYERWQPIPMITMAALLRPCPWERCLPMRAGGDGGT